MRALWFHARADLRSRWRAWAGLALLLGLAGGVALCALAGAGRTTTTYPRLLEDVDGFDVLVNPNDGRMDFEPVQELPQVAASGRIFGGVITPLGADGQPDLSFEYAMFVSRDAQAMSGMNRPKIEAGRMARPGRVGEAMVTPQVAEARDLEVGSRLDLAVLDEEQAELLDEGEMPEPTVATVTVVGIGTPADELPTDTRDRQGSMLFTPAFNERYHPAPIYEAMVVRLERGADTDDFIAAAQRAVPDEHIFFQTRSDLLDKADRAVRPYGVALAAFGIVAGLAALLIVGQALARQLFLDATEHALLSALGVTRRQLFAAAMARVGAAALAGAVVAITVAVALSPLTPVGSLAREIEPDPGIWWDGAVLLGGAAAAVVVLLAALAWPAWRAASVATPAASGATSRSGTGAAAALAGAGFPPSASAGVAMALEPGRGTTAVPVRAAITGAALSIGALTAALVFGSSLGHLIDTPRLYGADYDAVVDVGPGAEDDPDDLDGIERSLGGDAAVAAFAVGAHGQVAVDGVQVASVGLEPRRGQPVHPTMVEGRAPNADDEIALGSITLDDVGADVGDTVTVSVGAEAEQMRVVGRAVFPRYAAYSGSNKTGLGTGAALTVDGLRRVLPRAYTSFFLVRFTDGADGDAVLARLQQEILVVDEDDPTTTSPARLPDRPDDVAGYEDVERLPVLLAAVLLLLAGGTTIHALVASVRRRRRDLAILKTLGFERRQVAATIAWQATTVAVLAVVVGIPVGAVVGRVGWTEVAHRIGAVAEPVIPLLLMALVVPAALLAANLVAAVPGRRAGRTPAAEILHAE